jgi:5-methylcytosine-specific restriction endonuclease McrA
MPDLVREWNEAKAAAPGTLRELPPADRVLEELRQRFHRGETHLHCDHIIPIEERPDLRLDLENMQTLCDPCHRRKSMAQSVAPRAR